jgi:multiple antibiotic resistance protein
MNEFFLCFVPLFVAVDPPGILPLFLSLTVNIDPKRRNRVILQSVFTASGVALVFLLLGKVVLKYLGITIADFMISGGALLFVLSLTDLLSSDKPQRRVASESLGAVPLGVPLIVGPAVLTTAMLLVDKHGVLPTTGAVIANIAIAGGVFWMADGVIRVLGQAGAKILSKLASLLMAAIAVMMIRHGITMLLVE